MQPPFLHVYNSLYAFVARFLRLSLYILHYASLYVL